MGSGGVEVEGFFSGVGVFWISGGKTDYPAR